MEHSFDFLCNEYMTKLIEVINSSGMPLSVTRFILQDILATVNNNIQQALAKEAQNGADEEDVHLGGHGDNSTESE